MYRDIFSAHCVFQELGTGKTIDTGHEQNRLRELELTSDQVAYISTSTALDYHCQLGHPSLPTPKLFVPELDQISLLEYEFCQLKKHNCVLS